MREGGDVAEITSLLDLSGWPAGMRLIVPPGTTSPRRAAVLFEEAGGYRYQVVATNNRVGQLASLEARHRAHARVGPRPRPAGMDRSRRHHPRALAGRWRFIVPAAVLGGKADPTTSL